VNEKDKRYLLDTSALLTLIEGEEGAKRVETILRTTKPLIPWTALMEVHYITERERGSAEADQRYALLRALDADALWDMNERVLLRAARFKARHKLSFADTVIAAYAVLEDAVLVHKNPEYEALAGGIQQEVLRYK
jgi:predicted nucleic acid-binding protein